MPDSVPTGLLEHCSCGFAAADDQEQIGIRRLQRADAEIREHVADGAGQRSAAGVVVQSDP